MSDRGGPGVLRADAVQPVTDDRTRCRPEGVPVRVAQLQGVRPKSTSFVSTVPAVRPGAVW